MPAMDAAARGEIVDQYPGGAAGRKAEIETRIRRAACYVNKVNDAALSAVHDDGNR